MVVVLQVNQHSIPQIMAAMIKPTAPGGAALALDHCEMGSAPQLCSLQVARATPSKRHPPRATEWDSTYLRTFQRRFLLTADHSDFHTS